MVWSQQDYRLVMIGLDAPGKTTVLYNLKLGETVTTIPAIGFNVETIQYRKLNLTIWDLGGQKKIRSLWRHYYQGTISIIFVVDSNDPGRFELAAEELQGLLEDEELHDAAVLVLANKQDLPMAVTASDLIQKLDLQRLSRRQHPWYIWPCTATKNEGIYDGLEWLANTLSTRRK